MMTSNCKGTNNPGNEALTSWEALLEEKAHNIAVKTSEKNAKSNITSFYDRKPSFDLDPLDVKEDPTQGPSFCRKVTADTESSSPSKDTTYKMAVVGANTELITQGSSRFMDLAIEKGASIESRLNTVTPNAPSKKIERPFSYYSFKARGENETSLRDEFTKGSPETPCLTSVINHNDTIMDNRVINHTPSNNDTIIDNRDRDGDARGAYDSCPQSSSLMNKGPQDLKGFIEHWEKEALNQFKKSCWEGVISASKKVLDCQGQSKTNFNMLYQLGYAYLRLEDFEIAAKYLSCAARIDSKNVSLRLVMGELKRRVTTGPWRKR